MALKGGDKLEAKLKAMLGKLSQGEVLRVGFLETAKYPTGEQVAQVAFWNEYGTKTAPARPFFRNMIADKKGSWGTDLGKILKAVDNDVPRALALMGERIQGQLQQSIVDTNAPPLSPFTVMLRKVKQGRTDAPTTGADLAEARRRLASKKPGESSIDGVNAKPLIYTNIMRSSVAYDIKDAE